MPLRQEYGFCLCGSDSAHATEVVVQCFFLCFTTTPGVHADSGLHGHVHSTTGWLYIQLTSSLVMSTQSRSWTCSARIEPVNPHLLLPVGGRHQSR